MKLKLWLCQTLVIVCTILVSLFPYYITVHQNHYSTQYSSSMKKCIAASDSTAEEETTSGLLAPLICFTPSQLWNLLFTLF